MASNLTQFYRPAHGKWSAMAIPAETTISDNPVISGERSVFVRQADGHLGQYYLAQSGAWETYDITNLAGGDWNIVGSPSAQGRSVFARRDDGHLIQFYFSPEGIWEPWDISDLAGDGWVLGGDPKVEGVRSVWARRDDGHLIQFYFNTARHWEHRDITEMSGGRTIAGDPQPTKSQVLARDGNNHLCSFYLMADGQWRSVDMSENSTPPRRRIDGTPSSGSLVTGILAKSHDTLVQFHMTGPDGEWSSRDISTGRSGPIVTDPVAAGDTVYVTSHTGHLWEYTRTGGDWSARDLTESTIADHRRVLTRGSATVRENAGTLTVYVRGDYEEIPGNTSGGRQAMSFSRDGNWNIALVSSMVWAVFYNSCGTGVYVYYRDPTTGENQARAASRITLDNVFDGFFAGQRRAKMSGQVTVDHSDTCVNTLWSAGAMLNVPVGPGTDFPNVVPEPMSPTVLFVGSVEGTATVLLPGGEVVVVGPVKFSLPGF